MLRLARCRGQDDADHSHLGLGCLATPTMLLLRLGDGDIPGIALGIITRDTVKGKIAYISVVQQNERIIRMRR